MAESTQLTTSTRLSKLLLDEEQQKAITAAYEGNVLIYGKMGNGKTAVGATAITELLDDKVLNRVLIVTTPKIAETVWRQEFDKWEHTHHIKVARAIGDKEQRSKIIKWADHQVVVLSFNNLPWAKENKIFKYFDGLLIDEVTKLTKAGAEWVKSLKNFARKKCAWVCELTGTPVEESFEKLYVPMLLLDDGKALGTRKDKFLREYFYPTDYKQYNWQLKPGADKKIMDKIRHLVHKMPDYRSTLPPIKYHKIELNMPEHLREVYEEMRKNSVYDGIVAPSAGVKQFKLTQLVSGFIYGEDQKPRRISPYRVYALQRLLEKIKGNVIIFYNFTQDVEPIQFLDPHKIKIFSTENIDLWNQGKIKYLLVNPKSASHGLQLEQGGHNIVWFNNQYSNDVWQQANARLWRRGQKHPVNVYYFETKDSVDEVINLRVESKQEFDKLFAKHLEA